MEDPIGMLLINSGNFINSVSPLKLLAAAPPLPFQGASDRGKATRVPARQAGGFYQQSVAAGNLATFAGAPQNGVWPHFF